jgi:outer membrane biosynthesis protein TonB
MKMTAPAVAKKRIVATGLRKKSFSGRLTKQQTERDEGTYGLEIKKKSQTPLIIGIVAGVILVVVIIILLSGKETEKPAISKTTETEPKEPEKTPEVEKKAEETKMPEEKKPPKKTPKPKLEIDEALHSEILPLLKEMPKQSDEDQKKTKETIISKGKKKVIPILIKETGNEDEQVSRYASDILRQITKWSDAPNVNPMMGHSSRIDASKEWEDWWFKNKNSFPE